MRLTAFALKTRFCRLAHGLSAAALTLLMVGNFGCGTSGGGDPTASDASAEDGSAVGQDAAGSDGTSSAVDAGPTTLFELGTNVTGKNTRKFYTPVPEGATLNVELGPQGLWMVVLAFKTKGLLTDPLFLSGGITVEGDDAAGQLALKKQKTILSDDGFRYYYNFWLVVKNDELPAPHAPKGVVGKKATITLELTGAKGKKHTVVRHVTLSGGPDG
ncbi:MAG: hypothetical protein KC502_22955 [Myxococcales bacterium]|nr:hypothetical protein [Myxococcales bacterium]